MIENSTQGLTLLDAAHTVLVTGVDHHQPVLARWAPLTADQPRQVAAELVIAVVPHGPAAGHPGIEVRLDGLRVGELTLLLSQRYLPYVHEVLRAHGRAACVALVAFGPHELEMELRLPDVTSDSTSARSPLRPEPLEIVPRNRTPYLIGAGVLVLLLGVGVAAGGGFGEPRGASTWNRPTVAALPPTTTLAPEPTPTPTPAPTPAPVVQEVVETTRRAPAPAPVTTTLVPDPSAPPPVVIETPPPAEEVPPPPLPGGGETDEEVTAEQPTGPFAGCAEARAAGVSNIPEGDPRYTPAQDQDQDGIACEFAER